MNDMNKLYDSWNKVKKTTNKENGLVGFKQREIFYMKMGTNIGYEQNGKGEEFVRPVLIFKKFTKDIFLGIPLSTTQRTGSFFFEFKFLDNKISSAILVQARLFSSKRLLNKIGIIDRNNFNILSEKYKKLIFD